MSGRYLDQAMIASIQIISSLLLSLIILSFDFTYSEILRES
jgi:hypothetical protein